MLAAAFVLAFGLWFAPSPQSSECADAAACRQAALDAASRGDFEAFHDLAWRAVQKGRRNDPELMILLARAQSLSGRPGDALVMLRRLAQMGVATDAAASDDFRRVRDLPGWPDVAAMLKVDSAPPAAAPPPVVPPAAAVERPGKGSPPAARPRGGAVRAAAPFEDESLPLPLADIEPAGLAHDGVSRRFIVGDRRANKLVIFDEVFKRATDMVAAESAGFFGVTALEIDPRRGDLWVANSSGSRGASLHKLQLVSGRVLFELGVPASLGPTAFVDVAALGNGQVLLLDVAGRRLLGVSPERRAFQRVAAVDVDGATSMATIDDRIVYVAHRKGILHIDIEKRAANGVRNAPANIQRVRAYGHTLIGVQSDGGSHRVIRMLLDRRGRRITRVDVLDGATAMPDPSAMTIVDRTVHYITATDRGLVLRRVRAGK